MAGYSDTRQLIINTLMGRPAGTEIQPEDHQVFALALNDYIRNVELNSGNAFIGFAQADTVPIQSNNGQCFYISTVPPSTNIVYANFIDFEGNPISVTTPSDKMAFVTLIWNTRNWDAQITIIETNWSQVLEANIAPEAVTGSKIAPNSISTSKIIDGTIESSDLNPNAFDDTLSTSGKIAHADVVGSKLTELEQKVLKYVNIASFSIDGAINKVGNFTLRPAAKRTDFIKVKEGIKIKAYDGATSYPEYAAVAFYNANFEFISTMDFSTDGLKEITLTSSNIPSNAEYFIASTIRDYLSDSYVKFTDSNLSIISDSVVNMEFNGVKDDSFSLFTKHYFIYENALHTNEELFISTDFLPVDGISDIFFWQLKEQTTGKVVAFFDENKELMSDYGVNGVDHATICGKVEIPTGAKWVIFITRKSEFNSNIKISFNSIRGINLMIGELLTKVGNNKSSVDSLSNDVKNVTEYSNALKGVSFGTTEGDILFKNALKKVWIQILDPSFNVTTLKLVHFGNKSDEQYNPWIAFYDQNNNYAISWYDNNPTPRTGVQHLVINGFGTTYENLFYLHLVIDWDEIQEKKYTSGLQTTMDVSKLNKVDIDTRTSVEQLTYASNDWKDNTIICFGDSITEFKDSFRMSYTDYLKQFTGANIINIGIGGTQFRQRAIPVSSPSSDNEAYASLDIINIVKACCEQDFTNQIAANDWLKDNGDNNTTIINRMIAIDWSKVNAVTFFAGTNDWNNASGQWGESGSSDINTTLGAINEIIRLLLTTYPHIKIYWFTPIVRWLGERIPENFSDSFVRGTKTLKEFSAMIQTEVARHHIPICDMYNTLGWNMYNFSNYFTDTDGAHPSKGYMPIARKIKGFIDANRTF